MRYLHPNLEAKVQAVGKLAASCDNSVTVRTKEGAFILPTHQRVSG
jgi:hypothetical protein